jgi:hypothetical protein
MFSLRSNSQRGQSLSEGRLDQSVRNGKDAEDLREIYQEIVPRSASHIELRARQIQESEVKLISPVGCLLGSLLKW